MFCYATRKLTFVLMYDLSKLVHNKGSIATVTRRISFFKNLEFSGSIYDTHFLT